MALTDENGTSNMVMPVAPMYGNGGNGGFGDWGGSGFWIILLFILLGGWGNGFGGNGGNGGLYPWMNQSNQINDGFRDQMLNTSINGIQQGVNNLSSQLCNCCGDMQMALANGFAGVEQGANARQMANMQQGFALQSGVADLKYTVATENCADRTAAAQNTRDIIDSQTRGTQAILDKLCQLELDGVKGQLAQAQRDNVGLQNKLNMANLAASQTAQNVQIVDGIYNRLATCPVGSMPVYGNQPIFTCNNNGCGCGA